MRNHNIIKGKRLSAVILAAAVALQMTFATLGGPVAAVPGSGGAARTAEAGQKATASSLPKNGETKMATAASLPAAPAAKKQGAPKASAKEDRGVALVNDLAGIRKNSMTGNSVAVRRMLSDEKKTGSVTIVGNNAIRYYNGGEQTVSGYSVKADDGITVALADGAAAEAKGTDAGTYIMGLSEDDFVASGDGYGDIDVKVIDGSLTILPNMTQTTVKITGNSSEKTFNGAEQSVSGYTVEAPDDSIRVALADGAAAEAKGTYAGEYPMNLTPESFVVTSDNYSDLNVVVTDGTLTIAPNRNKVTVTITGRSEKYEYNGKEQTATGFLLDFTIPTDDKGLVIENKLLAEGEDEVTVSLGERSITVALAEGHVAEAKGTEIGEYPMVLAREDFTVSSGNFTDIDVVVKNGLLTIAPREVIVTADDKTKAIGAADPELTASVEGLIGNDTIKYTLTRQAGEEAGASYTITPAGKKNQGNYSVTFNTGTLTIDKDSRDGESGTSEIDRTAGGSSGGGSGSGGSGSGSGGSRGSYGDGSGPAAETGAGSAEGNAAASSDTAAQAADAEVAEVGNATGAGNAPAGGTGNAASDETGESSDVRSDEGAASADGDAPAGEEELVADGDAVSEEAAGEEAAGEEVAGEEVAGEEARGGEDTRGGSEEVEEISDGDTPLAGYEEGGEKLEEEVIDGDPVPKAVPEQAAEPAAPGAGGAVKFGIPLLAIIVALIARFLAKKR